MIRTRVGYAGGKTEAPSYRNMGDHTETIQVDYDPNRISYSQLLNIFWQSHQPTERSWSRQYKNAIFYQTEGQRLQAEASKAALTEKIGRAVKTEIAPLRSFTMAEDYHQKFYLKRHSELKRELSRFYPRSEELVKSTAAARLNAYIGGYGNNVQLSQEIETLGLSPGGVKTLFELVGK